MAERLATDRPATCSRHGEPLHLYVLGTRELPYVMEQCAVCDAEAADEDAGYFTDDIVDPHPFGGEAA